MTKRLILTVLSVVLAGSALGATVATAAFSDTSAFTFTGTNSCTGEAIMGTGILHFLVGDNLSASGAIEYHLNVRLDGLQAVAIVNGKKYVVQDTFNHEFVFSAASEDTFDITVHFIRVGEDGTFIAGDDFYEFLRTHITANANGMVTAFDVRTNDMPCQ